MGSHAASSASPSRRLARSTVRTVGEPGGFTVLMVCTGNICRSPVAEKLLIQALEQSESSSVRATKVHSAGLETIDGVPIDPTAAQQLRRYRGDPSGFGSRPLTRHLATQSDVILTMTRQQQIDLVKRYPALLKKTFVLREFARLSFDVVASGDVVSLRDNRALFVEQARLRRTATAVGATDEDIPDPFRQADEVHERVADLIATAIDGIARDMFDVKVERR